MRKTTKISLVKNILGLSGILIIGFFVFRYIEPYGEKREIINNPNKIEIKRETQLNSKISEIYSDRGFTYIKLNGSKIFYIKHSRNYEYSEPWINKFLQFGDSLVKVENSDTLWVYRGQNEYYFVLGEFIGQRK